MADVYSFNGYRYNQKKTDNLNQIVTPPYDKINKKDQEQFYKSSPYNIVRLIKGKDNGRSNKYQKAAELLDKWIEKEILIKEQKPCFYAYYQEYDINGDKKVRKGFVGLGKIDDKKGVKAHENTLEGPKADRLKLLRATEANFGHIFMLYSDKKNYITKKIDDYLVNNKSLNSVVDRDNNIHKLWKIENPDLIKIIKENMKEKTLYIADGHHRYQTALNFKNECLKKGYQGDFDKRLMTFINIEDPGLKILATHRLVYGLKDFNPERFLDKIKKYFKVFEYNNSQQMFTKLKEDKEKKHSFGYKSKQGKYCVLTLQNSNIIQELAPEKSSSWHKLDVAILHKAILEKYLGIGEKELQEKSNLDYIRYKEKALDKLEKENYQACFILNPTPVKQVKSVADRGEKMPQKSTDFYPKLLTGLIMHKLNIKK